MAAAKKQFHRSQISRAQAYIRKSFTKKIKLGQIAKEAGASPFHFARIFQAYTQETPFEFLNRVRLSEALESLQLHSNKSITDVALDVGFETPSSFNKSFKKALNLTPTDFRKMGKAQQARLIYDLGKPRIHKEIPMNLNKDYQIITRPNLHFAFLEDHGPFRETAPALWPVMFQKLMPQVQQEEISEFLGLATVDQDKLGKETLVYRAGLGLKTPRKDLKGVKFETIPGGKYASFILKGPYSAVWLAFNEVYKILSSEGIELRKGFSIDKYLNDPNVTPEEELLTELLVPIK